MQCSIGILVRLRHELRSFGDRIGQIRIDESNHPNILGRILKEREGMATDATTGVVRVLKCA
ncbi:hypothetical protein ADL19_20020 [Streptomyces purpurogeneiscleroticus]|nr:hypothetical protein ADL19_20020 [Streptomyces purpurogeneiscleroticus]